MKGKAFININNLPAMRDSFCAAVSPCLENEDNPDISVAVIGEPGVGKSYITAKLSQGVLGQNIKTKEQVCPRDNMHDLILWSNHKNDTHQIIQYDDASLRFVDEDYHNFVMQERENHPLPDRDLPGISFIEHPDEKTENEADIVVRISFSDKQSAAIQNVKEKIENDDRHISVHKKALSKIASLGCEIEIETSSDRINTEPLEDFFEQNQAPPPEHS